MLDGIRKGQEGAYRELFREYYRPLTVFALRYVSDLDQARDLVQDLFVHLYENRTGIQITSSLRSYLYQSVRNRCLNYLDQQKSHREHQEKIKVSASEETNLEAEIERNEMEHRIFRVVDTLPQQCKRIFLLSRVKGLKNEEIARQLGISKRTVETQISNALKKLKAEIS
jgi:RNA polymerase sigma-70 factor (ECF subfamily)